MGGKVTNTLGRGLAAVATGGISEFAQKNPFLEGAVKNPLAPNTAFTQQNGLFGGNSATPHPSTPGPFSLDLNQFRGDRAAINDLGDKQYADTLAAIDTNSADQQKYAGDTLNRMLPGVYEDMNARHLLNSSATGQEVGRQASNLAQDLASQRGNAIQAALTGKQGFQTGALQRGLSMEDFVNQANVAKTIGAQMAPQPSNGKGTAVAGLGAGAAAGAPFGPWGSAAGAGLGALLGSSKAGK